MKWWQMILFFFHRKCVRLPFNWKNPIGYSFAVLFHFILYTYIFSTMMTMVSVSVASFLYEFSLTEDLKCILHSIDENSKTKKNRRNLYAPFAEFINLHSDTKQLSIKSKAYSTIWRMEIQKTHMWNDKIHFVILRLISFALERWPFFRNFISQYLWFYFHEPFLNCVLQCYSFNWK